MPHPNPHAELPIPHPAGAVWVTVGYLLVLLFVVIATGNLFYARHIPLSATIASLLWLSLVGFVTLLNLRDEGVEQYVVNRLGTYSRRHYVRATPSIGKAKSISIGYQLFGRDFSYLNVDADAISSVDWNSGQATSMAGRDMNDWHVALWHRHPQGPQRTPFFPGARDDEIFIFGRIGPRPMAEAFGKQLVEFLITAGVELTPGTNGREFNSPARSMAIESSPVLAPVPTSVPTGESSSPVQ
jgi:hypothetical protein